MTEEEEFFAWLDGELGLEQAAKVEARVAASPELSARAAEHRRFAAGMRDAFATVLEAGVPPPSFGSAEAIDFGARAVGREARRSWLGLPPWVGMAATLAIGLLVGSLVGRSGSDAPIAIEGGQLVAAASLDQALDSRLASVPNASGPRIGLTFRGAKGSICRSFEDEAMSGLACRSGRQWRIHGLFKASEGQSSDYRMAAGQDPRLGALIDGTISGEPFDAAQERAARQQGWR